MAVVGLGAGAISCYAHAGDVIHFYEIDPVVCEIASNPELFSYLRHCPGAMIIPVMPVFLSISRKRKRTM